MRKITPHHLLTPKGGRVASRVTRHVFRTQARSNVPATGAVVRPGSHNPKTTRTRGAGIELRGEKF